MRVKLTYLFVGILLNVFTFHSSAAAQEEKELPSAAGDTIHDVGTVKSSSDSKVITDKPGKRLEKKSTKKAKKSAKKGTAAKKKTKKVRVVIGQTRPLSDFEVGRYQYCGDDRDCVTAVNGCCDCANGGKDVAVNKERYEAFRARFDCLNYRCGNTESPTGCENGVVSCVNHKCQYFGEAPPEQKF